MIDETALRAALDPGHLAGAALDVFEEVEAFGKAKRKWLKRFVELPKGLPSPDTFGRVFAPLDPAQLQACFLGWVRALS